MSDGSQLGPSFSEYVLSSSQFYSAIMKFMSNICKAYRHSVQQVLLPELKVCRNDVTFLGFVSDFSCYHDIMDLPATGNIRMTSDLDL
ncbi:hypothetical protein MAR_008663 [Mya arenaria]|uniref:Uncharacterized protein n=1 Tax=Mya arenaria TaxID=6604 RepID=A0ABY7DWJ8_MYAAR|nr:hypothetical protein MAR_008663 [Mya arenaria]